MPESAGTNARARPAPRISPTKREVSHLVTRRIQSVRLRASASHAAEGDFPPAAAHAPEDDASPPLPCRLNDVNKTSRRRLANAFDMSASETSARARLQSDGVMVVLHFFADGEKSRVLD